MASTTIVFGVLLIVIGLAGYFGTGTSSFTALIPAAFGLVLLLLGALARAESRRKHAMHAAAMVGLIGFAGALMPLLRTPAAPRNTAALLSQGAMAALMLVFVLLCVKSFIDARRARSATR